MALGADQLQVEFYRRGEADSDSAQAPVLILAGTSSVWAARSGGEPALKYQRDGGGAGKEARLYVRELLHEDDCDSLPGLDHTVDGVLRPSMVRDAARLALQNTDTPVEVALVVADGIDPWDLAPEPARPEFSYLLRRYLEQRTGAVVVLPDAAGPPPVAPHSARSPKQRPPRSDAFTERWNRLARNLGVFRELLQEYYLIALCDAPIGIDEVLPSDHLLSDLTGIDGGVCTWAGTLDDLRRHSWRSAAAVVGAALSRSIADLSTDTELSVPVLTHHDLRLGNGRVNRIPRLRWAGDLDQVPRSPESTDAVLVHLGDADRAPRIVHDASLRRPLGDWPLPALWTAKQVIRRVEETASAYVFATADAAMAIDLSTALQEALEALIGMGVLVGPDGEGAPLVEANVETGGGTAGVPLAPRLVANISTALAPWLTQLNVKVEVDQHVRVQTG